MLKLFSVILLFVLFGCASSYHVPPLIDTSKSYASVNYSCQDGFFCFFDRAVPQLNPHTFNPTCSDQNGLLISSCKSYYAIAVGQDPATKDNVKDRTLARDLIVNALITASTESSSGHQAGIQANQSDINLFLKLATAGLTGAGAVAGVSGAQAFSAAAGGTNAAQIGISDEVYQKKIAGSINYAVTEAQRAKLIDIYKSLAEKDVYEYNVQRGISDAIEFHELGSFYKALEISSAALSAATAKKSSDNAEAAKELSVTEQCKTEKLTGSSANQQCIDNANAVIQSNATEQIKK